MTEKNIDAGPSLIIGLIILLIFGLHCAFAGEQKFEFSPFMDFNGSVHGGLGSHNDGFAASVGAGAELLYVVNDNFAFGINGKTNLNYDNYLQSANDDDVIVDEYGTWTSTFGGIVYMGESFYLAYMAIYHMDTFHESTYLSCDDGDIEMKKAPYKINELNYLIEVGFRASYHMAIYADVTTHLVETEVDRSKYQIYFGLKYHI